MEIKIAETDHELKQAYRLRWEILRRPWNQPEGSETDELESTSITAIVVEDGKVLGTGRAHFSSEDTAQVRYMAVGEDSRGRGIGGVLLDFLEEEVMQRGAQQVFLNSREKAVAFYLSKGYKIIREVELLYGEIRHFRMEKRLF